MPQGASSRRWTSADEHPRPAVVLDKLAGLPSIVEGGIITAGNASGVNDGAVALILGSREAGDAAVWRLVAVSWPARWPACHPA